MRQHGYKSKAGLQEKEKQRSYDGKAPLRQQDEPLCS
jgi:hypothetical protein